MLRGAQTVVNRDKTSTRASRQECQKTTQDECQKTSFRNRAEHYWLRPLSFARRGKAPQSVSHARPRQRFVGRSSVDLVGGCFFGALVQRLRLSLSVLFRLNCLELRGDGGDSSDLEAYCTSQPVFAAVIGSEIPVLGR